MAVKPILFSGSMVRALLDGRKTQTRRVTAQPPPECGINYMLGNESWMPVEARSPVRRAFEAWHGDLFRNRPKKAMCGSFDIVARFQPRDILWVRETWCAAGTHSGYAYAADAPAGADTRGYGWRPSIHMPRAASRLTLTVTDVRVQRLQEVDEADAKAEGAAEHPCRGPHRGPDATFWAMADPDSDASCSSRTTARAAFGAFWNLLNEARGYGWDANPWVAAVTFTVERANVDTALKRREVVHG